MRREREGELESREVNREEQKEEDRGREEITEIIEGKKWVCRDESSEARDVLEARQRRIKNQPKPHSNLNPDRRPS